MPTVKTRPLAGGGVTYYVRLRDPRRDNVQTSEVFDLRPDAEKFCRMVEALGPAAALDQLELERDGGAAGTPTLDEWAERHFDALTEPSEGSVKRYRRIYAACWQPTLGHMHLAQITRTDVAAALNKIGGRDKTRKNKWAVLTHMLKMAAEDGLIARSPTVGVKIGRRTEHETEEHRYLTIAEFSKVLAATPAYWRPLVMMLAGSGMRWGEAAALLVGDVDTEHDLVRVTKAEKQDPVNPTQTYVGPAKSRKSRRSVTLPSEVMAAVEPLLEGRKRTERLFLPPRGGPLRHRTFYRDIWLRKSVGKSGISEPFPRLHDLRHSHVAWLIAEGVPLPVIQARLGHEKITTTIDTYGHLLPDLQVAAAQAASVALRGVTLPDDAGDLVSGPPSPLALPPSPAT